MNYLLIADAYEPATISAAQQLRDLVAALAAEEGNRVIVLIPDIGVQQSPTVEPDQRVTLIRARCMQTKDVGYLRRTLAEFLLPFFLYLAYRKSSVASLPLNGILWYSPTIFLGPIVAFLKWRHGCRSYLILRDLFPDWAVDAGAIGKGLAYRVLKWVESYQYRQADVIGVQTAANLPHLQPWKSAQRRIEVLPNWLAPERIVPCALSIAATKLAGRRIIVYAGNMGVAQDMWPVMEMVRSFKDRNDWGFLFVGRGSEVAGIGRFIAEHGLDNALLLDEIPPEEIPGLFAQCEVGLLALDPRHTTHNIPGKFIAYMRSGLPVLGRINPGNDLIDLIRQKGVGEAVELPDLASLLQAAGRLLDQSPEHLQASKAKARALWAAQYCAEAAAVQIGKGLV